MGNGLNKYDNIKDVTVSDMLYSFSRNYLSEADVSKDIEEAINKGWATKNDFEKMIKEQEQIVHFLENFDTTYLRMINKVYKQEYEKRK